MMTQKKIEEIIQSGEGYTIEWKRNVNSDLAKEMVAFANSSGGRIFVGIDDEGKTTGVKITNELRSQVQAIAHDCDPSIVLELEAAGNVLVVHVPEGKNKPYRCTNGFYIRNGANSEKLSTSSIRDFFNEHGRIHFDEMPFPKVGYPKGVDKDAVRNFMALLDLAKPIVPDHLLRNLGVLNQDHSSPVLNGAGVLCFAKEPTRYIPQSSVTCVAYKDNTKVDIIDKKTFEFNVIDNIDESLAFLKRHLNLAFEIKSKQRVEKLEIPEVALREAVVNAVAHRDYSEKGATVMIEVFNDRIEISNPGGLPKGLDKKDFGKRTLARNPLLASLLNRAGYIEKLGTGIERMRSAMKNEGLAVPSFQFDHFFTVTFKRIHDAGNVLLELQVSPDRMKRIAFIMKELYLRQTVDIDKVAAKFKTPPGNIRKDLRKMEKKNWIVSSGATTNRVYQLTNAGKLKAAVI
jgi:ATP-dependent DNA helicase RecG